MTTKLTDLSDSDIVLNIFIVCRHIGFFVATARERLKKRHADLSITRLYLESR